MITEKAEQDLVKMSHDVDAFFFEYLEQNQEVHVLHLFSIVLARMAAISNLAGITDSYRRLLEEVLVIIQTRQTANTNANYH